MSPALVVYLDVPLEGRGSYTYLLVSRTDARGTMRIGEEAALPAQTELPSGKALSAKGRKYPVQGLELTFMLNATARSVTFSGSDPLTGTEVASQVEAAVPDIEVVDGESTLCFRSRIKGVSASLYFDATDAASFLEIPTEEVFWGRDPLPRLVAGVERYSVLDPDGLSSSRYSYQLTDGHLTSPASVSFRAVLPGAAVSLMRFRLQRNDGGVASGQRVTLFLSPFYGDGGFSPDSTHDLTSDADGYVEFRVRRGVTGEITLPGTQAVHKFLTPSVDIFDPFDPAYAVENDAFRVREPDWGDTVKEDL